MLDAFVRIPSGEPVICPAALALATDERGKKRLGESRYVPRLSESLAQHGILGACSQEITVSATQQKEQCENE